MKPNFPGSLVRGLKWFAIQLSGIVFQNKLGIFLRKIRSKFVWKREFLFAWFMSLQTTVPPAWGALTQSTCSPLKRKRSNFPIINPPPKPKDELAIITHPCFLPFYNIRTVKHWNGISGLWIVNPIVKDWTPQMRTSGRLRSRRRAGPSRTTPSTTKTW